MPARTSSRTTRPGKGRRTGKTGAFRRFPRGCRLCKEKIARVDYKDTALLSKFVTEQGKIITGRISGNCASHQRQIARAIRQARVMALMPFIGE
ncbi:MAG: 30S ribosomal protein S18 [Candidatus Omnitrophica bacterium]|jgi:small subunit ribosomal protein S18|nr:30S ribosomal protein S18 [Candidatus Omnitrophota bacterium]